MPGTSELLSAFEHAESLADAELALDAIRAAKPSADADLGDLYDGLAEAAAESDDYELAVRAQRRAVELGCEYPELARQMLAWYLLRAAPAEAAGGIAVSPHSARSGTRFVVSFVAPRPEPARGYRVRLRAANTQEEGCVAKVDFYNPKAVRPGCG